MKDARTLVLATGGTGGHIYPALAVAAQVQARGHRPVLLGQKDGLEERLAAEAGVEFRGVASGKLDRQKPDPAELLRALRGIFQARTVLRELKPALVLGFGGFASLPGTAAAAFGRVPLWLNEQNAWPGLVTRLLSRRAELVICSVAAAEPRIRARATRVIPYPIDETAFGRSQARRELGLPEEGTLTLVMGGSQGSVALNDAVLRTLPEFGAEAPLTLHVTGPANFQAVSAPAGSLPGHHLRPYVDGRLAFAAADLAITRAGIGTLSMAAWSGVPPIMVPLPTSAENHQYHNAKSFADAGAGVLLEQKELVGLHAAWQKLLDPANRLAAQQALAHFSPAGALSTFSSAVIERLERAA